jgi:hypothetical protein
VPEQEALVSALSSHHAYWVHIDQQRRRRAILGNLRVKHVSVPEAQLEALKPIRVLVKQVPQISRRLMGCGNSQ